jgi:hypothetical protein
MIASDVLTAKIAVARGATNGVHRRFWSRDDLAVVFPTLQEQTYHLAAASIPLMEAARARCHALADHDLVAAGLIDHLTAHIAEEVDHDRWLLEDLEVLGVPSDEVRSRPASLNVAQLIGAQYYWIHHEHPVALFGYMAALEGGVASSAFVEELVAESGLPRAGLRTLLHHAEIDVEHGSDLLDLLDALPLTERHRTAIGTSAISTVVMLAKLADDVMAQADRPSD